MINLLIFILFCLCVLFSYKLGEKNTYEKIEERLQKYLNEHESMKKLFEPGIEAAQHIIEQIKNKDSI